MAESLYRKTALLNVVIMGHYGGIPGINRLSKDVDRETLTAAQKARRNLAVLSDVAMVPGLAAAGVVYDALKQYDAFTRVTQHVRGQTNITTTQLAQMRKQTLGFLKEYGQAIDDTSNAYYRAYSSQNQYFYRTMNNQQRTTQQTKDARAVVAEAVKGSYGTGDKAEGIANTIGSALFAYNRQASALVGHLTNAQIVMAEMHTGAADSNMKLGQFAQNLSGVLPMAKNLGISLSQLGGMYSALTKGGITGPQAQTQVRGLLTQIQHPTPLAVRNLETVSNQTGIDLVHAFSAEGIKSMGLPAVFQKLREALRREKMIGRDPTDVLSGIITQRRGLTGIFNLLSDQGMRTQADTAHEMVLSGQGKYKDARGNWVDAGYGKDDQGHRFHRTVTDVMADAYKNSLPGQMARLKGSWNALMIDLGRTVSGPALSIIKPVIGAIQSLDKWISVAGNAQKAQNFLKIALAVGAIGGGLRIALGTFEVLNKLASANPYIIAIAAGATLYATWKPFRDVVNSTAGAIWNVVKFMGALAGQHPTIIKTGLIIGGIVIAGFAVVRIISSIVRGFMSLRRATSGMGHNPFAYAKDAFGWMSKLAIGVSNESREAEASARTNKKLADAKGLLATNSKQAAAQLEKLGVAVHREGHQPDMTAINEKKNRLATLLNEDPKQGARWEKARQAREAEIAQLRTEIAKEHEKLVLLEQQYQMQLKQGQEAAKQAAAAQRANEAQARKLAQLERQIQSGHMSPSLSRQLGLTATGKAMTPDAQRLAAEILRLQSQPKTPQIEKEIATRQQALEQELKNNTKTANAAKASGTNVGGLSGNSYEKQLLSKLDNISKLLDSLNGISKSLGTLSAIETAIKGLGTGLTEVRSALSGMETLTGELNAEARTTNSHLLKIIELLEKGHTPFTLGAGPDPQPTGETRKSKDAPQDSQKVKNAKKVMPESTDLQSHLDLLTRSDLVGTGHVKYSALDSEAYFGGQKLSTIEQQHRIANRDETQLAADRARYEQLSILQTTPIRRGSEYRDAIDASLSEEAKLEKEKAAIARSVKKPPLGKYKRGDDEARAAAIAAQEAARQAEIENRQREVNVKIEKERRRRAALEEERIRVAEMAGLAPHIEVFDPLARHQYNEAYNANSTSAATLKAYLQGETSHGGPVATPTSGRWQDTGVATTVDHRIANARQESSGSIWARPHGTGGIRHFGSPIADYARRGLPLPSFIGTSIVDEKRGLDEQKFKGNRTNLDVIPYSMIQSLETRMDNYIADLKKHIDADVLKAVYGVDDPSHLTREHVNPGMRGDASYSRVASQVNKAAGHTVMVDVGASSEEANLRKEGILKERSIVAELRGINTNYYSILREVEESNIEAKKTGDESKKVPDLYKRISRILTATATTLGITDEHRKKAAAAWAALDDQERELMHKKFGAYLGLSHTDSRVHEVTQQYMQLREHSGAVREVGQLGIGIDNLTAGSLGKLPAKMAQISDDAMNQFNEGIRKHAKQLQDAGEYIINKHTGLNRSFETGSKTVSGRDFMRIGYLIGEQISKGIRSAVTLLLADGEALAKAIVTPLNKLTDNVGGTGTLLVDRFGAAILSRQDYATTSATEVATNTALALQPTSTVEDNGKLTTSLYADGIKADMGKVDQSGTAVVNRTVRATRPKINQLKTNGQDSTKAVASGMDDSVALAHVDASAIKVGDEFVKKERLSILRHPIHTAQNFSGTTTGSTLGMASGIAGGMFSSYLLQKWADKNVVQSVQGREKVTYRKAKDGTVGWFDAHGQQLNETDVKALHQQYKNRDFSHEKAGDTLIANKDPKAQLYQWLNNNIFGQITMAVVPMVASVMLMGSAGKLLGKLGNGNKIDHAAGKLNTAAERLEVAAKELRPGGSTRPGSNTIIPGETPTGAKSSKWSKVGKGVGIASVVAFAASLGIPLAQNAFDPQHKSGASQAYDKVMSNKQVNDAINIASGASILNFLTGGKLFKTVGKGAKGGAGMLARLMGMGGTSAATGAEVATTGAEVAAMEGTGAAFDATGVGLPIGLILGLAGVGLMMYQNRHKKTKPESKAHQYRTATMRGFLVHPQIAAAFAAHPPAQHHATQHHVDQGMGQLSHHLLQRIQEQKGTGEQKVRAARATIQKAIGSAPKDVQKDVHAAFDEAIAQYHVLEEHHKKWVAFQKALQKAAGKKLRWGHMSGAEEDAMMHKGIAPALLSIEHGNRVGNLNMLNQMFGSKKSMDKYSKDAGREMKNKWMEGFNSKADKHSIALSILGTIQEQMDPKSKKSGMKPKEWAKNLTDQYSNQLGLGTTQFDKHSNDLMKKIRHWLKFASPNEAGDKPEEWGKNLVNSFSSGMLNRDKYLEAQAKSNMTSVKKNLSFNGSGLNPAGDNFHQSGENIAIALSAGMVKHTNDLHDTGKKMATAVHKGGKFYELGTNVMKWTIQGIQAYINGNKTGLNALGKALADAMGVGANSSADLQNGGIGAPYNGLGGVASMFHAAGTWSGTAAHEPGNALMLQAQGVNRTSNQLYDLDYGMARGTKLYLPGSQNQKYKYLGSSYIDDGRGHMGHELTFGTPGGGVIAVNHLDSIDKGIQNLTKGQMVSGGSLLGTSGYSSGQFGNGAHLCVVIDENGQKFLASLDGSTLSRADSNGSSVRGLGGVTVSKGNVDSGIQRWVPIINDAAKKTGVPAALIAAVMQQESGGDPRARSNVGATGLMQLMNFNWKKYGVSDPYNPQQNVMGGARMLAELLKKSGGDINKALRGYTGGYSDSMYNNPVYQRAQRYAGASGGGGVAFYGGGGTAFAASGDPATAGSEADPFAPPKSKTTNNVHYTKWGTSPRSFNPVTGTGQYDPSEARMQYFQAKGTVAGMETTYGPMAIANNKALLERYSKAVAAMYNGWAESQIASMNAVVHRKGGESTATYNRAVAGIDTQAHLKTERALNALRLQGAREQWHIAQEQYNVAKQTWDVFKSIGGRKGVNWGYAFLGLNNKQASAMMGPAIQAGVDMANARHKATIASINAAEIKWGIDHHGESATMKGVFNAQRRAENFSYRGQRAAAVNEMQQQFWQGRISDMEHVGTHYRGPHGEKIDLPALQFLRQMTAHPNFKTMTAGQRNQWLGREHQLITGQTMEANMKAQAGFAAYKQQVDAGLYGGNAKERKEMLDYARQGLAEQIKSNNQLAIANWQRAQQKASASGQTGSGRPVPVRVIGHCADGSVPGTSARVSAAQNPPKSTSHNAPKPLHPNYTVGNHPGYTVTRVDKHHIRVATNHGTTVIEDPNNPVPKPHVAHPNYTVGTHGNYQVGRVDAHHLRIKTNHGTQIIEDPNNPVPKPKSHHTTPPHTRPHTRASTSSDAVAIPSAVGHHNGHAIQVGRAHVVGQQTMIGQLDTAVGHLSDISGKLTKLTELQQAHLQATKNAAHGTSPTSSKITVGVHPGPAHGHSHA